MKKFILATTALVLGLTVAGSASAHEPYVAVSRPRVVIGASYYSDYGTRFSGGYYYRGQDHHHWDYRVWNTRYNRYQYYDPTLRCYYYWNPVAVAYYPCD